MLTACAVATGHVAKRERRLTLRQRMRAQLGANHPGSTQARIWAGKVGNDEIRTRCHGTIGGDWCSAYHLQTPIPAKAPPRGNRTCLNNCNGAGICNFDLGTCACTAGWTGDYCQIRQKRPCTNQWRKAGGEATISTKSTDKGWTASRCYGVCDVDIAACYCNGTYGRIPARAEDPPLWSDPVRMGRHLSVGCRPKLNDENEPADGGTLNNTELFGPNGWCEAPDPPKVCVCDMDGWDGPTCETPHEAFCINQCSGHGDCRSGFCRCHPGYYGHDCARRVQNSIALPGLEKDRPWLHDVMVQPPAATDPPILSKRLRPLIYIYDLPPDYNSLLLQYRNHKGSCVYRMCVPRFNSLTEICHLSGHHLDYTAKLTKFLFRTQSRPADFCLGGSEHLI
eukprot:jgi/Botrbrau1/12155/Bobra.0186s0066.1